MESKWEEVCPIPWGITRLFAMFGTLLTAGSVSYEIVTNQVDKLPTVDGSMTGALAGLGLLVAVLALLATGGFISWVLLGPYEPYEFAGEVYRRNVIGYRAHIWRSLGGDVVWDPYEAGKSPTRPPYGNFSISIKLSGRFSSGQALIYDWRSGLGGIVQGLTATLASDLVPIRRTITQYIRLSDACGDSITVHPEQAFDFWISDAIQVSPLGRPSLGHAAVRLHLQMQEFASKRNELSEKLVRVTEGRDNLQERFTEQHALAAAAIGVIWEAIWDIFKTKRFGSSSEGRNLRIKLTSFYSDIMQQSGAEKHDFTKFLPNEERLHSTQGTASAS